MAKLQLFRGTGPRDIFRRYKVTVDGRTVCRLWMGQRFALDLPPGRHTVSASIDWCSAAPLTIDLAQADVLDVRIGASQPTFSALDLTLRRKKYLVISLDDPRREPRMKPWAQWLLSWVV